MNLAMLELDSLLSKKLLFISGKGGIGKTVVASALAQRAAVDGKRVLLVESTTIDQIAPLFGMEPVGHKQTLVADNLYYLNLNFNETFREYIVKYLGQPLLMDKVFNNRVVRSFINTVPGLSEMMLLGRLYYAAEVVKNPPFDLVIFDSYASGHFLSLMTTPDAILSSGIGGPLVSETSKVMDFLKGKDAAGIVLVGSPEELVVSELLEFLPLLIKKSPVALSAVMINFVRKPLSPEAMAYLNKTCESANEGNSASAHFTRNQYQMEEKYLTQLRAELNNQKIPFKMLPHLGSIKEPLASDFHTKLFGGGDLPE